VWTTTHHPLEQQPQRSSEATRTQKTAQGNSTVTTADINHPYSTQAAGGPVSGFETLAGTCASTTEGRSLLTRGWSRSSRRRGCLIFGQDRATHDGPTTYEGVDLEKTTAAAAALTALLGLTACAEGGEGGGNEKQQPDPVAAIEDVPSVSKSVELTESTDPNDMLGRPNGYTAATVFYDKRASCDEPGGRVWSDSGDLPDSQGAKRRSEYILEILKAVPALGSEYHFLDDGRLLRVTGELTPTQSKAYESAFTGG